MQGNITLPSPGNVTATPDIPTMFTAVSANLGIPVFMLFLMFSMFIMIPLSFLKVPKIVYPVVFGIFTIFGSFMGLVPIWISVIGFILPAIVGIGELSKAFDGTTASNYIESHYKPLPIQIDEPEHRTENCKNCGGPNVDRVTCQWCGLVLD